METGRVKEKGTERNRKLLTIDRSTFVVYLPVNRSLHRNRLQSFPDVYQSFFYTYIYTLTVYSAIIVKCASTAHKRMSVFSFSSFFNYIFLFFFYFNYIYNYIARNQSQHDKIVLQQKILIITIINNCINQFFLWKIVHYFAVVFWLFFQYLNFNLNS